MDRGTWMVSGEDLRTAMRKFTTGELADHAAGRRVGQGDDGKLGDVSIAGPASRAGVRGHGRNTHDCIVSTGRYCGNVLSSGQAAAAAYFANDHEQRTGPEPVEYTMTERGSPKVLGSIAFLDCEVVGSHPHGDHVIFVGEVKDAVVGDGEPLVFFDGRFLAREEG